MYLLDTHAMLWYLRDSPELSASAHALIDNAEYVAVSIASFITRDRIIPQYPVPTIW